MNMEQYYKEILPGYHENLPDEFCKLAQLLELNQFELLEDGFRLVYLMNDAVESFLVFENARMTGTYDNKYEGEIKAFLEEQESGYALIVHQNTSVFTIFFEKLLLEVHLYNYGETGHFWVKDYEYLRQIEYKIAILRDKYRYLGAEYCNDMELRLVALADFPPLNYCCYPAVPEKYLVTDGNDWMVTEEAFDTMFSLAKEAGDKYLERSLRRYRRFPGKYYARKIARMLHRNSHEKTVKCLTEWIKTSASRYENRAFSETDSKRYQDVCKKAFVRQKQLENEGKSTCIYYEEPFVYAKDSIEFQVHLLVWKKGLFNRKSEVETFKIWEGENNDE